MFLNYTTNQTTDSNPHGQVHPTTLATSGSHAGLFRTSTAATAHPRALGMVSVPDTVASSHGLAHDVSQLRQDAERLDDGLQQLQAQEQAREAAQKIAETRAVEAEEENTRLMTFIGKVREGATEVLSEARGDSRKRRRIPSSKDPGGQLGATTKEDLSQAVLQSSGSNDPVPEEHVRRREEAVQKQEQALAKENERLARENERQDKERRTLSEEREALTKAKETLSEGQKDYMEKKGALEQARAERRSFSHQNSSKISKY